MNLGRVFANAVVRRLAYLLVAAVLAWAGLSDAKAACAQDGSPQAFRCATEGEARAAAEAYASSTLQQQCAMRNGGGPGQYGTAKKEANYWQPGWHCVSPYPPNASLGTTYNVPLYRWNLSCQGRPLITFSSDIAIPTGSVGCNGGCAYQTVNHGDGTYGGHFGLLNNETCSVLPSCTQPGWYINHATSMCQPPEVECPGNQTKNPKTKQCEEACPTGMVMDPTGACKPSAEECPAGNVRAPSGQCLPGEGQCAAGEARRPNGTCGRDSDGDGQADEDDDDPENDPDRETASGGDSCNSPPSCSGGPIMCLQAKIQWRIDCNTRKNINVSGGTCGAIPICTGDKCDALEYSQLLMQWRTACALEKLSIPGPGQGGDGETIKPDFEGLAAEGDGADPQHSIFLPDSDGEGFNQSLISYGGGALGWNFSVEGQQFGMPQQISDFIALLKWLIIAAASLVGIAIAAGKL